MNIRYRLERSKLWPLVKPRWWAKQKLAGEGNQYYGNGGTIHSTGHLDVEIGPDGHVVSVWFRCLTLPFEEHRVDGRRAQEMNGHARPAGITGIEIQR